MADQTRDTDPLLRSELRDNDHHDHHQQHHNGSTDLRPAKSYFRKPIKNITYVTIPAALIAFVTVTIAYFIIQLSVYEEYPWRVWEYTSPMIFLTLLTLFITILNRLLTVPTTINILLDFYLTFALFYWIYYVHYFLPSSIWCRGGWEHNKWDEPSDKELNKKCSDMRNWIVVFMIASAGAGAWVALGHTLMLTLRLVACVRAKFWRRTLKVRLYPGKTTVGFSMNVVKD